MFSSMLTTGRHGPAPKPPSSAYDWRGCLPISQVSDGCCNMAKAGPRFEGGFCCYTIELETCC